MAAVESGGILFKRKDAQISHSPNIIMTKTYSIPSETRFNPLRNEAEHYLRPAGFSESTLAR